MRLLPQSAREFVALTLTGMAVSGLTGVLLTDYRGLMSRYVHRVWTFYQRPRWRWMHPTTEAHDRIVARVVGGLGVVIGLFILGVEIAALVDGKVAW